MKLRDYQSNAIDAIYRYFGTRNGNPILALPTGTGKSVVIAAFLERMFRAYPNQRVLMLTHVKELIEQNFEKLMLIWPTAPAGIYSAGLKRREVREITFAGIATVAKRGDELGHFDLVLIDECHLVSPKQMTSYQSLLAHLKILNPKIKVIGLTATPFRLGQGLLTQAVEKAGRPPQLPLFTDIAFDLTSLEKFNSMIDSGWMVPLVPKATGEELDVSKVTIRGGEFVASELQTAVDRDEITGAVCDEVLDSTKADPRFRWLVFAAGVDHANHVASRLREKGVQAWCVHSKTKARNRAQIIEWFKSEGSDIRCIVNNGVFTTGFDAPTLDLIVMLRPTSSPGLWVQMLGRGTRPAPGKRNCLVLDFAGNTRRLGPINDPTLPRPPRGGKPGQAPVKVCGACDTFNHIRVRECVNCGEPFPIRNPLDEKPDSSELVKKSEPPEIHIYPVDSVSYAKHVSAKGPTMKVTYVSGLRAFNEWVCLEHEGFAAKKARNWWRERALDEPPDTIDEALDLADSELMKPTHVKVWVNKKWPTVTDWDFDNRAFGHSIEKESVPF